MQIGLLFLSHDHVESALMHQCSKKNPKTLRNYCLLQNYHPKINVVCSLDSSGNKVYLNFFPAVML